MSGSTLGPWAVQKRPEKFAKRLAKSVNCTTKTHKSMMDCLRSVDHEAIMKVK